MTGALTVYGSAVHQVGGCLILSVSGDADEHGINHAGTTLLQRLNQTRARGVVIDVSNLKILSANEFGLLKTIARSVAMMGATPVFAGFAPGVAASLVELDTCFDDIVTTCNTDDALAIISGSASG